MKVTGHPVAAQDEASTVALVRQCRPKFCEQARVDDRNVRAAILEKVGVIMAAHRRARRHHDGSNFHAAEVCGNEFWAIRENQQHSLSWANSEIQHSISSAVHLLRDIAVGKSPATTDDRDFFSLPLLQAAIHKLVHEIVAIRNLGRDHRRHLSP
jgi:hypothetical protein